MAEEEPNPVDQLIDLFVYAPVGLLYEYQEVLPKLVKRGKSQVQLAKVVGQMAVNRGNPGDAIGVLAEGLASVVARQITELGEAIGLAPPKDAPAERSGAVPADEDIIEVQEQPDAELGDEAANAEAAELPLPIARYDELTAKEIIPLLNDLETNQLDRIRDHEEGNRARKTVLGKIDRLAG